MSVRDDYFRFEIEDDKPKNDIFSIIIKSLVILLLFVAIASLSIFAYRFLKNDNKKVVQQVHQVNNVQPVKTPPQQRLKKEELALIIKAVLAEVQKQANKPAPANVKKSEDSELLNSLQNVKVENIQTMPKQKVEKIEKIKKEIAHKKIEDKIIKKQITYNAVVINNKAVKNLDELSKLYAQINKISKKKKKKILKSAYTKKIKKEIIIRKNAMRTITVRQGDTLGSIAQRAYGKASMYKKIFDANPDILVNPHNLKVGLKLRVPK